MSRYFKEIRVSSIEEARVWYREKLVVGEIETVKFDKN